MVHIIVSVKIIESTKDIIVGILVHALMKIVGV